MRRNCPLRRKSAIRKLRSSTRHSKTNVGLPQRTGEAISDSILASRSQLECDAADARCDEIVEPTEECCPDEAEDCGKDRQNDK
jgi:ATP-dependent helicase YprA (DUF1998 family)